MPGNELDVIIFLYQNIGKIDLPYTGVVRSLSLPGKGDICSIGDCYKGTSDDSSKKADIYINDIGVSIKQEGGSNLYNRLQRANLKDIFTYLEYDDVEDKLYYIDNEVNYFHNHQLENRNRPWQDFFSELEFKDLVRFLMMEGSGAIKISHYPAELILEAPKTGISIENLNVYSFDEYFEENINNIYIAIRRGWIGQSSRSEHVRALGLSRKKDNLPWVFNDVSGVPRTGWNKSFPVENRKTVYYLMIEKTM